MKLEIGKKYTYFNQKVQYRCEQEGERWYILKRMTPELQYIEKWHIDKSNEKILGNLKEVDNSHIMTNIFK